MADIQAAPLELGTEKIGTLLKMYAVPGIIAQTAASLYNIVDSIYIGHIPGVGANALSGLAVTFPLMNLSIALGTLVGVGGMTLISIMLGQKNYASARKVLANVLSLNVILGIIFAAVTLTWLDPILYSFGASENTIPFARDYMRIILLGNVFTHLMHGFNGIIRCSGHPRTAMGLTLFTVISNAILDPIFIFALGMGIKGAALATVICQILALVYTFIFLSDKKRLLHFSRPLFQIRPRIAWTSIKIGLSPFLMNTASCIVAIFVNQQLLRYGGDLAIGSYGIINRFTTFFIMICLGFNQGLQPIAGYNYGARQYKRVKEVFILTAKWELLITGLCFLCSELFPGLAAGIFTTDATLEKVSASSLRIANAGFLFVGFAMATGNFFQCLGMVRTSIFLSLSRQILLLLPLIYFLPGFFEKHGIMEPTYGIWISFAVADVTAMALSLIFIIRLFKKFGRLQDGSTAEILGSSIQ